MVNLLLLIGVPVAVIVIAGIVYTVLPRFGPHYTSRLTCSKCGKQFDYNWLPGGSFTAVRLGKERYMRCPLCHEWSTFDIWSTRIHGTDDKANP
jgi:DNA-directed RNA polymerase subunit RPC12/RpoP